MKAKVTGLETLACDAGWRNYHFVKLTTDEGVVGWSEFDEGFGSPGVGTIIERLAARVVGQPVDGHERIYAELCAITRPAAGGVVAQALGAIENALLDAKAQGARRAVLRAARRQDARPHPRLLVALRDLAHQPPDALRAGDHRPRRRAAPSGARCARRASPRSRPTSSSTSRAARTARAGAPASARRSQPELNVERHVLRNLCMHLEALRDGAGPDVDMLLDLNFNAKTEGYLKILRAIADLDMFWVEIDSYNPEALGTIRRQSPHPIASCETLLGLREFLPYFREQAMDVAIVDTPWNGVWQSMKIAAAAEAHEVNVAPHNFYGHLCTMMNAHFAAAVPNLRIMETDIDRAAPGTTSCSRTRPRSSTATCWCRTAPAGAPSRTRRRSAPTRRRRAAGWCSRAGWAAGTPSRIR